MNIDTLPWYVDDDEKQLFLDSLAPVVLFVYNRPIHTRKTIEALKNNFLSEKTDLFIYSDGSKGTEDKNSVEYVRKIIKDINGFKSVSIVNREINYGLGSNIIDGVTSVIKKYGRIIVLEDDVITSKYFLKYMNDALEYYKNEKKVMSIASYCPPFKKQGVPETYFLPWFECCGWATWSRSWNYFEKNPKKLIKQTSQKEIDKINIYGRDKSYWQQVLDNAAGKKNTWAIFYFVTIVKRNGLVLYPKYRLQKNIGFDGSGTNCTTDDCFYNSAVFKNNEIKSFPDEIKINKNAEKHFENYSLFMSRYNKLFYRFLYTIKYKGLIFAIKKSVDFLKTKF